MPHIHRKSCPRVTGLLLVCFSIACFSLMLLHSPLCADDLPGPLVESAEKSPATEVPQTDQASAATPVKRYQVTLSTTAVPTLQPVIETIVPVPKNTSQNLPDFNSFGPNPKEKDSLEIPFPQPRVALPAQHQPETRKVVRYVVPPTNPSPPSTVPHQPNLIILTCDSVTLETDSTQEEFQYEIRCSGKINIKLYGMGDIVEIDTEHFDYCNGVINLTTATLTSPTYQLKAESLQLNIPVAHVAITKAIPANHLPMGPAPNPADSFSPYPPSSSPGFLPATPMDIPGTLKPKNTTTPRS